MADGKSLGAETTVAQLNERRKECIFQIFSGFDRDGSGAVPASDLKGAYVAHLHPKVQSGELSEDEVFLDFLTNFTDKNRDGKVHWDEWLSYYSNVSARIANDDHFCQLLKPAWRC